jgi:hypothetical protein
MGIIWRGIDHCGESNNERVIRDELNILEGNEVRIKRIEGKGKNKKGRRVKVNIFGFLKYILYK